MLPPRRLPRRPALLTVAVVTSLLAGVGSDPEPRTHTRRVVDAGQQTAGGLRGTHAPAQQAPRYTAAAWRPGATDVQRLAGRAAGEVAATPFPGRQETREDDAAWVASGTVPGATENDRAMAVRALLDLRSLTFPNGATVAAQRERWRYVWPRDAAFTVAAFSVTDHHDDAERVLGFLGRAQRPDGTWDARYHPSDAAPVQDGRESQLDANGWVPWAVWFWYRTHPDPVAAQSGLTELWPMVAAAADHAAASLGPDGMPPASADYWERSTDEPTLGTAGPLLSGLRSATDLAAEVGDEPRRARYADASVRLSDAVDREFAPHGYTRTPDPDSGADAAVTFLAPPFGSYDAEIQTAVEAAEERLLTPSGGLRPGEAWSWHPETAWTPATSMFALAAAASGDREGADHWLGWLERHRTPSGSFPERVTPRHRPVSVAPLGWTSAVVVLALAALERPLPVPPDPEA